MTALAASLFEAVLAPLVEGDVAGEPAASDGSPVEDASPEQFADVPGWKGRPRRNPLRDPGAGQVLSLPMPVVDAAPRRVPRVSGDTEAGVPLLAGSGSIHQSEPPVFEQPERLPRPSYAGAWSAFGLPTQVAAAPAARAPLGVPPVEPDSTRATPAVPAPPQPAPCIAGQAPAPEATPPPPADSARDRDTEPPAFEQAEVPPQPSYAEMAVALSPPGPKPAVTGAAPAPPPARSVARIPEGVAARARRTPPPADSGPGGVRTRAPDAAPAPAPGEKARRLNPADAAPRAGDAPDHHAGGQAGLAFQGRLVDAESGGAAAEGAPAAPESPGEANAVPPRPWPASAGPALRQPERRERPEESGAGADSSPGRVERGGEPPAGAAPRTESAPPAGPAGGSQRGAASAAPQAPRDVPEPPARPPARDIQLEVGGGERRVSIHLVERRGEIHFAVRTPDATLADDLRRDLPALTERLEHGGFRAETWRPEFDPSGAQTGGRPDE
ncbi:MAG: hypothetical protein LAQ30_25275 [Acidobacteriia bacterium]|nr:hypothetical protein [Terriglobia bacterium]